MLVIYHVHTGGRLPAIDLGIWRSQFVNFHFIQTHFNEPTAKQKPSKNSWPPETAQGWEGLVCPGLLWKSCCCIIYHCGISVEVKQRRLERKLKFSFNPGKILTHTLQTIQQTQQNNNLMIRHVAVHDSLPHSTAFTRFGVLKSKSVALPPPPGCCTVGFLWPDLHLCGLLRQHRVQCS